MEGEAVFCYEGGWGCSNDATYVVERDLVKKEDGSMVSMHTPTVRLMDHFINGKKPELGSVAEVIFRSDGTKIGYKTKIKGITDGMVVLAVSGDAIVKNILDTIKKQNYG